MALSNSTVKARITNALNKLSKDSKNPGEGDILIPCYQRGEEITDNYGDPYRIAVTHVYHEYVFGLVTNNVPGAKKVSETLVNAAFPKAVFKFDTNLILRAELEGVTPTKLAIDEAFRSQKIFLEYKKWVKSQLKAIPERCHKNEREAAALCNDFFIYREGRIPPGLIISKGHPEQYWTRQIAMYPQNYKASSILIPSFIEWRQQNVQG